MRILTNCAGVWHNMQVDLLTLKVVSESCDVDYLWVPILVFLGFSVHDLGQMYATDRCQMHTLLNAPYPRGGWHKITYWLCRECDMWSPSSHYQVSLLICMKLMLLYLCASSYFAVLFCIPLSVTEFSSSVCFLYQWENADGAHIADDFGFARCICVAFRSWEPGRQTKTTGRRQWQRRLKCRQGPVRGDLHRLDAASAAQWLYRGRCELASLWNCCALAKIDVATKSQPHAHTLPPTSSPSLFSHKRICQTFHAL